jgi:energy-coupling factor transporter ATP-binding protein EcfA2
MTVIEARGLRKAFGKNIALDGIDLRVDEGRILGIIGPNGAGKTTALNAILGLTSFQGELRVLGRNPWAERDRLMRDVCFIADVAVLPRWMLVSQALDYVEGWPSWQKPRLSTPARSGIYPRAWWRNCISLWSWPLMPDCWSWMSRRSGSTFCFASSFTIPCSTITSIAAAPSW